MYEIKLRKMVIAPGGSLVYHPDLMEYLKERCTIIYLDVTYNYLQSTLENAASRGIVGYKNHSLKEIYDERHPLYCRYADITINPQGKRTSRYCKR